MKALKIGRVKKKNYFLKFFLLGMAYYYGVTRLLGQDENVRASINRKMKSQLSVLLLSERTIDKEKIKRRE